MEKIYTKSPFAGFLLMAVVLSCNKTLNEAVDPIIEKEKTEANIQIASVLLNDASYQVSSALTIAYDAAGVKVYEQSKTSLSDETAKLLVGKSYSFYSILNSSISADKYATESSLNQFLDKLEMGAYGSVKNYIVPELNGNVQILCSSFDRSGGKFLFPRTIDNACAKTGESSVTVDFSGYGTNAPENLSFSEKGVTYKMIDSYTGKFSFSNDGGIVNGIVTGTCSLAQGEGFKKTYYSFDIQAVIEIGLYYVPIVSNEKFNTETHKYDVIGSSRKAYLFPCPMTKDYGAVNKIIGMSNDYKFFAYYGGVKKYVYSDGIYEPRTDFLELAQRQTDYKKDLVYAGDDISILGSPSFPTLELKWDKSRNMYVITDDLDDSEKKNIKSNLWSSTLQLYNTKTGAEIKEGESYIYSQNGINSRLELKKELYNEVFEVWPLDNYSK